MVERAALSNFMPPKRDWEKSSKPDVDAPADDASAPLDEGDIQLLKTYGQGPYAGALKRIDAEIKEVEKRVSERMGCLLYTSGRCRRRG